MLPNIQMAELKLCKTFGHLFSEPRGSTPLFVIAICFISSAFFFLQCWLVVCYIRIHTFYITLGHSLNSNDTKTSIAIEKKK